MSQDITQPLRLAVGSHAAGSGKGCAMNVISWENGDKQITDFPACSDRLLARIVQQVNDTICTHTGDGFLCPDCSVKVLELGHRTVGTGTVPLSDLDHCRVWVRIAADQARQVLHLASNRETAERAILAAEAWAENPTPHAATAAANPDVAADAAANAASYAASYAATAATAADAYADANAASCAAYAAYAAADATNAAAYAAYAADAADARLRLAHRAIDVFEQWTGHRAPDPNPERTARAVALMLAK